MPRNELGRALRAARHDRGLTQIRLSSAVGVPVGLIGRWEHGEAVPAPQQLRSIAEVLGVGAEVAGEWLDLRSRTLPPPEPQRRAAVTVEILPSRAAVAVAEPPPPPPARGEVSPGAERRSRRRVRRAARGALAGERRAAERAGDEARRRTGRTSPGAAAPPVFAPDLLEERSHVIATVNSGVVFPVPAARRTVDKLTYGTGAPTYRVTPEERMVYRSRWMRVLLIMIALVALLWWSVAQLGDGWDAVLDLFRSEDGSTTTIGALVLRLGSG